MSTSVVVYICRSNANKAAESPKGDQNQPTHHTIWSTSIPPASPHQNSSSTTATVPSPSIANRHVKRRLHMYANCKSGSSKLFRRTGPTYTPYHMMVESRPLYLLLRLMRAPLRLRRRYHAHPLLTGTSNVVYIGMPFANQAVASSLADQDQPTHHTI